MGPEGWQIGGAGHEEAASVRQGMALKEALAGARGGVTNILQKQSHGVVHPAAGGGGVGGMSAAERAEQLADLAEIHEANDAEAAGARSPTRDEERRDRFGSSTPHGAGFQQPSEDVAGAFTNRTNDAR